MNDLLKLLEPACFNRSQSSDEERVWYLDDLGLVFHEWVQEIFGNRDIGGVSPAP